MFACSETGILWWSPYTKLSIVRDGWNPIVVYKLHSLHSNLHPFFAVCGFQTTSAIPKIRSKSPLTKPLRAWRREWCKAWNQALSMWKLLRRQCVKRKCSGVYYDSIAIINYGVSILCSSQLIHYPSRKAVYCPVKINDLFLKLNKLTRVKQRICPVMHLQNSAYFNTLVIFGLQFLQMLHCWRETGFVPYAKLSFLL